MRSPMNIVAPLSTPMSSTASPPYVARICFAILSTASAICSALKTTSSDSPRRRDGSTIILLVSARSTARTNAWLRRRRLPSHLERRAARASREFCARAHPDGRGYRSVLAQQRHYFTLRKRQTELAQEPRKSDRAAPARGDEAVARLRRSQCKLGAGRQQRRVEQNRNAAFSSM